MFYTGSDGTTVHACYATSVDGVTWTKPNLGLVSYGGSTNNNILLAGYCNHGLYDATSAKWIIVQEPSDGSLEGYLYTADQPNGPYMLVKTLIRGTYFEVKGLVRRANDSRWVLYYIQGHSTQDRSISAFVSDIADLTGTWTDVGELLDAPDQDNQFYQVQPWRDGSTIWAAVGRYNKTTERIHADLYRATDDGLTLRQHVAQWIDVGAAGEWDDEMIFAGAVLDDVDTWRVYYGGTAENHAATPPRDGRIGRANAVK